MEEVRRDVGPMKRTRLRLRAYLKCLVYDALLNVKGCQCLPSQCLRQFVILALNLKDLDRLVRGAGSEPSSIIIQHSIVLSSDQYMVSALRRSESSKGGLSTYNHIIVTGICDDLRLFG